MSTGIKSNRRFVFDELGCNPSYNERDEIVKSIRRLRTMILDVNVIVPNKVVEVTFIDEDKQKSVCQEPDRFSMEMAISICITKHLLNGSGEYNKAVKAGIRCYEDKLLREQKDKEEAERIEKRRAKRLAYKQRRAEKRREEQIEIQKEAYIRAMKAVKESE